MRSICQGAGSWLVCSWVCLLALACPAVFAAEPAVVRIGVLAFGTVSWELEVMQRHGFAEREGVRLQIVLLAQKDAANVAVQGGAVDVIVNDWLWVARQRAEGRDYSFVPYSTAVGSLMVRADSGVQKLSELRGRRVGVAGGPVDKSWLLLRAYARKTLGEDAAQLLRPDFVAPPLINELAQRGELAGAFNYWHYAARMQGAGWRELLGMPEILSGLGIPRELPLVGWVFSERWAKQNPAALAGFLRASAAAKQLMATSDVVWNDLRPLTKADSEATLRALRDGFRAGIPPVGAAAQQAAEAAAGKAFAILAREGGKDVVGNATQLAAGVFWHGREAR